ncbi:LysR family transcriptional regulator [Oceanospirillum sediminis]|uniref:LysR family transcriptional regulator n=1 Tax=Oceanospirillum sediminis TaxID=2760088 RepID=A0A839IRW8_9GAMM|nr:LysR family transcriptional regulator [Oceanospirillum sediminis]MBB1487414.1 LysR family transcriptional regulator [Oceanospirillum sediminis]
MRLRNLNTFVKVARLGSFHAAAQQLHATQPTISSRINALETELGTQLFIRDKSGTRLSARGMQLLPYAEKLLAISQEMKQQIAEENPQRGTLRIGIADTLSYLWLSPLLKHWQSQHPLISFELISDVTPTLIHQLQECQLDLALMVADTAMNMQENGVELSDLVTEPLCSYPQCWVASPDLLNVDEISRISDLVQYPVLSFPRNTRPWRYLQKVFSQADDMPVFHTCSSVTSLLTLSLQGVGIALLPEPIVRESIESGRLSEIQVGEKRPLLSFCCSWRLDDDRIVPGLLAESARQIMKT